MPFRDDEIDADVLNEKLISRRHRIFRNLANVKLTNVEENKRNAIRDRNLRRIESELKELDLEWQLVSSKSRANTAARQLERIEQCIVQYDTLGQQIDRVKTELRMFQSQLKRLQLEKDWLLKKTVSDNEYARNIRQAAETVQRLENRVYDMNVRIGHGFARNRQLRAIAELVLRERMAFAHLFAGFVEQLARGKKELIDLVDQVVLALDGGTDLCKRIILVKKKADDDRQFHQNELTELMQSIYVNEQKYDFFAQKGRHNAIRALAANECRRRALFKMTQHENVDKYRSVLRATEKLTGEADYVDVINSFKKYEHDFMSYYLYLNVLNLHMENVLMRAGRSPVMDFVAKGKGKKVRRKSLSAAEQDDDDATALSHWQEQSAEASRSSAAKEDQLNELQVQINDHFDSIKQWFKVLGCEKNPKFATMRDEDVHLENYQMFLAAVEMRLKEVLSIVYYTERLEVGQDDTYVVRDVEVTKAHPYTRDALQHLIPQCAECVATENVHVGRERAVPLDNQQLLDAVKKVRPQEMQHRLHHINKCPIPRCHMLYVKHMQNSSS